VEAKQVLVLQPQPDDLATLIARTARGDEVALADLYDQTCATVYGLALRIARDHAMAEEVTADVYLQVWRQAARFDPARGTPLSWLLVLARSRAIEQVRTRARQLEEPGHLDELPERPAEGPGPEEQSAAAQRHRLVRQAMMELPREQHQVIERAYFLGLSHAEIAVLLDEPLGTVKTRIRLAMTRLRAALAAVREEAL